MRDLRELDVLIKAAYEQRRQQAPRNRREVTERIFTLIAIHLAADHYSMGNPRDRGTEPADCVTNLMRYDSFFAAKVDSLHANIMQALDDYAAQTGLDFRNHEPH